MLSMFGHLQVPGEPKSFDSPTVFVEWKLPILLRTSHRPDVGRSMLILMAFEDHSKNGLANDH